MQILFTVKNQTLKFASRSDVVAASHGYLKAKFVFTKDWEGTYKIATFSREDSDDKYGVKLDDEGICSVPWEVLTKEGEVQVAVAGYDSLTDEAKLITVNEVWVPVLGTGFDEFDESKLTPTEPFATTYMQELVKVGQQADASAAEAKASAEEAKGYAEEVAGSLDEIAKAKEEVDSAIDEAKSNIENAKQLLDEGLAEALQEASVITETVTEQARIATEQANDAKASAVNASNSALSASASASSASSSENKAKEYAEQAKASANNASASEANAKTSETNSASSSSVAVNAATNANTYSNSARTYAEQAQASATAAKTSETNAKASADSSATESSKAAASATSASNSADSATNSSVSAASSASNAASKLASLEAVKTSIEASVATSTANLTALTQLEQQTATNASDASTYAAQAKAYMEEARTALAGGVKVMGSVATYDDLPTNAKVGDMYNIVQADATHGINAGDNVVYTNNGWDNFGGYVSLDGYAKASDLPTKVSELENDKKYITLGEVPETDLSGYIQKDEVREITEDELNTLFSDVTFTDDGNTVDLSNYATKTYVDNAVASVSGGGGSGSSVDLTGYAKKTELATVATSGSYNDLTNKPTIPTKTSQLTNDSNFLTAHQSLVGLATEEWVTTTIEAIKEEIRNGTY